MSLHACVLVLAAHAIQLDVSGAADVSLSSEEDPQALLEIESTAPRFRTLVPLALGMMAPQAAEGLRPFQGHRTRIHAQRAHFPASSPGSMGTVVQSDGGTDGGAAGDAYAEADALRAQAKHLRALAEIQERQLNEERQLNKLRAAGGADGGTDPASWLGPTSDAAYQKAIKKEKANAPQRLKRALRKYEESVKENGTDTWKVPRRTVGGAALAALLFGRRAEPVRGGNGSEGQQRPTSPPSASPTYQTVATAIPGVRKVIPSAAAIAEQDLAVGQARAADRGTYDERWPRVP